jgi:ribonuclease BN (tRNA processing enzyme)
MKLSFLGVSMAFSIGKDCFQSNLILESDTHKKLLIDCGSDVRHSLNAFGLTHQDIDAVYIGHLHSDHIGGLEWLGFSKRFIENKKISLFVSDDQRDVLWEHALVGGMSSIEEEQPDLHSYFNPEPVPDNQFTWEGIHFELIKTEHAICNGKVLPSYGLFITKGKHRIFFTGDARFSSTQFNELYKNATIIFQDCETSLNNTKQHARYDALNTLDKTIKQKMWLYDYDNNHMPDAKADGFMGFVKRGQTFEFI